MKKEYGRGVAGGRKGEEAYIFGFCHTFNDPTLCERNTLFSMVSLSTVVCGCE